VVDQQFVEIGLRKYILFLIQILTNEEEGGISLGDTGDIGLKLRRFAYLLQLHLRGAAYLIDLKELLMADLWYGDGVSVLLKDVGHSYLLIIALSLEGFPDARGHLDVLVRVGSIDRVDIHLPVGQVIAARLRSFFDDGLILDLALGAEVVGQHVFPEVLQEVLLEKHLVELGHWVAKQLYHPIGTIFSSSLYRIPPEFSTP
jgi:hypothetical protein